MIWKVEWSGSRVMKSRNKNRVTPSVEVELRFIEGLENRCPRDPKILKALGPLFCNEAFQLGGGRLENRDPGEGSEAGPRPDDEAATGASRMKLWVAHPERGLAIEAELDVRTTG